VITSLPARFTHHLDAVGIWDGDERLRRRPAADVWSPLEYLAHNADAIHWYADRVQHLLAEDQPILEAFDWDAHTAQQRYDLRHLDDVLAEVHRSTTEFTALLAGLSQDAWQRAGTGSDGGRRTIAQLTHRAAHEAQHHLHDITTALPRNGPVDMGSAPIAVLRAVIFDFDGLLMDTESTSLASWEYEWSQWGLHLDRGSFFVGHGGDVTQDRYATLAAAVGARFDAVLSHQRRTAYRDRLHEQLDLADGIRDWLIEAADAGLRLAVASSSPVEWVHKHLAQAGVREMFDVVAGGDQVAHHKPAPDVYALALERLGLRSGDAIAVEDTPHGVDAAHAAGLACIAIPNPFVTTGQVTHADLTIATAANHRLLDLARAAHTSPNDPRRDRGQIGPSQWGQLGLT